MQADAEEIERLFTSGTLRPLLFENIPQRKTATYVNSVCSEKLRSAGDIKFRTRTTISGDLLNAMISDNIALATIDLEDFYLGTPLPHAECIRIPSRFIPPKVIAYYKLGQYLHKGTLYCTLLKTHITVCRKQEHCPRNDSFCIWQNTDTGSYLTIPPSFVTIPTACDSPWSSTISG